MTSGPLALARASVSLASPRIEIGERGRFQFRGNRRPTSSEPLTFLPSVGSLPSKVNLRFASFRVRPKRDVSAETLMSVMVSGRSSVLGEDFAGPLAVLGADLTIQRVALLPRR